MLPESGWPCACILEVMGQLPASSQEFAGWGTEWSRLSWPGRSHSQQAQYLLPSGLFLGHKAPHHDPAWPLTAPDSWYPGREATQEHGQLCTRPEWVTWGSPQDLGQVLPPLACKEAAEAHVLAPVPEPQFGQPLPLPHWHHLSFKYNPCSSQMYKHRLTPKTLMSSSQISAQPSPHSP